MFDVDIVEEISEENLFLRKISHSDVDFFYDFLKNDQITDHLSLGPLKSIKHAKRLVQHYLKGWEKWQQFNYVIELIEGSNRNKIGSTSLWDISWQHKRAEIGIWLIPTYWNRGIGEEVVNLLKLIAFNHLKLNRIQVHVSENNKRSLHLFEKTGFQKEGLLKKYLNLGGKFQNAIVMAFLERTKKRMF